MSASKIHATLADILAGTSLIIAGLTGMLVRLGVLDFSRAPQWLAFEHWWPLLLIIAGLVAWLGEMERDEMLARSRRPVEIPYGK